MFKLEERAQEFIIFLHAMQKTIHISNLLYLIERDTQLKSYLKQYLSGYSLRTMLAFDPPDHSINGTDYESDLVSPRYTALKDK